METFNQERKRERKEMLDLSSDCCLDQPDAANSSFVHLHHGGGGGSAGTDDVVDTSALQCDTSMIPFNENDVEGVSSAVTHEGASSPQPKQGAPIIALAPHLKRKRQERKLQLRLRRESIQQDSDNEQAATTESAAPAAATSSVANTPRNQHRNDGHDIRTPAAAAAAAARSSSGAVPRVASLMNRQARERVTMVAQQQQPRTPSSTPKRTPVRKHPSSSSSSAAGSSNIQQQQQQQQQQPQKFVAGRKIVTASAAAAAGGSGGVGGPTPIKPTWNSCGTAPPASPRGGDTGTPRGMSEEHKQLTQDFIKRRSMLYAWNKKLKADFFARLGEGPTGV